MISRLILGLGVISLALAIGIVWTAVIPFAVGLFIGLPGSSSLGHGDK
jgi:hypothetical protein